MCIDIKPEGDSLLKAISLWLSYTNEQQYTQRVFHEIMMQITCGLVANPKAFAMYIKDMPSYLPFQDLLAFNTVSDFLTATSREIGMSIFFKVSRTLGNHFYQVDVLPKVITTNSLYLDIYQEQS